MADTQTHTDMLTLVDYSTKGSVSHILHLTLTLTSSMSS